jgi:hypothetical protein
VNRTKREHLEEKRNLIRKRLISRMEDLKITQAMKTAEQSIIDTQSIGMAEDLKKGVSTADLKSIKETIEIPKILDSRLTHDFQNILSSSLIKGKEFSLKELRAILLNKYKKYNLDITKLDNQIMLVVEHIRARNLVHISGEGINTRFSLIPGIDKKAIKSTEKFEGEQGIEITKKDIIKGYIFKGESLKREIYKILAEDVAKSEIVDYTPEELKEIIIKRISGKRKLVNVDTQEIKKYLDSLLTKEHEVVDLTSWNNETKKVDFTRNKVKMLIKTVEGKYTTPPESWEEWDRLVIQKKKTKVPKKVTISKEMQQKTEGQIKKEIVKPKELAPVFYSRYDDLRGVLEIETQNKISVEMEQKYYTEELEKVLKKYDITKDVQVTFKQLSKKGAILKEDSIFYRHKK